MSAVRALKTFLPLGALAALVMAVSLSATAVTRSAPALAAEDAGTFLVSFGEEAAAELNDAGLTKEERAERFRALLNEAVDMQALVKFILGRYWRVATPEERMDFQSTFEEIALQRFLPMFEGGNAEFSTDGFEVQDVRPAGKPADQVFVQMQVRRPDGTPVTLVWRLREVDEAYKILDISVEGISMALTLREEYGSVIRQKGGVGPLVALLRDKIAAGAYAPPAEDGQQ
ncbi:MAG TPA: ABC transporter substrate-binding protein [Kiloniellaceae bacterium]|nr:ABC transporter substrate-binding protein [Kiloniellaceae bacterium]